MHTDTLLCRSEGLDHFNRGHIWWREIDQRLHTFIMRPGIISPHPVDGGSSDITSGWQRRPCADYDTIPVTDTQTCDQTLLCGRHKLDLMLQQLSPRKDLMPRWWDLKQSLYYYLQRSNTDVRAQFLKAWKVLMVWIIVQGQRARRAKAAMDSHTAAEIHVACSWTLANTCTHRQKLKGSPSNLRI